MNTLQTLQYTAKDIPDDILNILKNAKVNQIDVNQWEIIVPQLDQKTYRDFKKIIASIMDLLKLWQFS